MGTKPKDYNEKLEELKLEYELQNSKRDSLSRSRIAFWFTVAFVVFSGAIVIGGPIYNATFGRESQIDIGETLANFVAHFGTPLGFVLGYYFKDKNSN